MSEETTVSGIELVTSFKGELPVGKVVVAGHLPMGFPKVKKGDMIAYSRGNYTEMEMPVDGVLSKVRIIYASDYRGKFEQNEESVFNRFVVSFGLGFASGYIAGNIAPFRQVWRKLLQGWNAIQSLRGLFGKKNQ